MAKKIIILSDGTGNSAAKLFRTNVWRLYQALKLSGPDQIAYYDDGVGTSAFKPLAYIGGAFGWGLKRNILDLYTFLCRNYREGDQIFAFGFSRGAFTIRLLINLVLTQGLIADFSSNTDLRLKGRVVYRRFRQHQAPRGGLVALVRIVCNICVWPFEPRILGKIDVPSIAFIGAWDTVDAYGIPVEEFKIGIDRFLWPISLNDRVLDRRIEKACHALSLDDQRLTFHPLLWDERNDSPQTNTECERLTQVWFLGAHSNVGGGYPDDSLAHVPLNWMVREATKRGLRFDEEAIAEINRRASCYGKIYNSRANIRALYRYAPRKIDPSIDKQCAKIGHPKIHESVLHRIANGSDSYAPLNIPARFRVVLDIPVEVPGEPDQNIVALVRKTDQIVSSIPIASLPPAIHSFILTSHLDQFSLETTWDTVWWRQVAYWTTAFCLVLIICGFVDEKNAASIANAIQLSLVEPLRAIDNIFDDFFSRVMSGAWITTRPLIIGATDVLTSFLPKFVTPAIKVVEDQFDAFAFLFLVSFLSFGWGAYLDRKIADRSHKAWYRPSEKAVGQQSTRTLVMRLLGAAMLFLYGAGGLTVARNTGWGFFSEQIKLAGRQPEWLYPSIVFVNAAVASYVNLLLYWFQFSSLWAGCSLIVYVRERLTGRELRGVGLLIAHELRTSWIIQSTFSFYRKALIPGLFAMLVVALSVSLANKTIFNILASGGLICERRAKTLPSVSAMNLDEYNVDISNGCTHISHRLVEGSHYRFTLLTPTEWTRTDFHLEDKTLGGGGIWTPWDEYPSWLLRLPMRRMLRQPWLKPIIRIGNGSFREFPMGSSGTYLELTPEQSTEDLYFYVNDAVLGMPGKWDTFYKENHGAAVLRIELIQ